MQRIIYVLRYQNVKKYMIIDKMYHGNTMHR